MFFLDVYLDLNLPRDVKIYFREQSTASQFLYIKNTVEANINVLSWNTLSYSLWTTDFHPWEKNRFISFALYIKWKIHCFIACFPFREISPSWKGKWAVSIYDNENSPWVLYMLPCSTIYMKQFSVNNVLVFDARNRTLEHFIEKIWIIHEIYVFLKAIEGDNSRLSKIQSCLMSKHTLRTVLSSLIAVAFSGVSQRRFHFT